LRNNKAIHILLREGLLLSCFNEVKKMKKGIPLFTMYTLLFIFCAVASLIDAQASEQAKIVFWSYDENHKDNIYIMNSDGTEIVKLMGGDIPMSYIGFSLSPDCKKVAFTISEWDGNVQAGSYVAVFDIYTKELVNLTKGKLQYCGSPRWSPDGKHLAFNGEKDLSLYIYIIDSDGTNLKEIIKGQLPDWSYDGQEIAFAYEKDIYVMNVNDKKTKKIMDSGLAFNSILSIHWSPNSKKILFAVYTPNGDNKAQIYTMDSDGSNLQLIMKDMLSSSCCWSPDGQKIAIDAIIGQNRTDDDWRIWIMNPDGNNLQRLTNNNKKEWLFDWRDPSSAAVKPLKTIQTKWAWIKQGN
jgi:dipeptidyl aminopeptidase/acylaminoacyl peptidase